MSVISISLPHHSYDVVIQTNAIKEAGAYWPINLSSDKGVIFSDGAVSEIYGEPLKAAISGKPGLSLIPFESGESKKTIETVTSLYSHAIKLGLERKHPIIALGGGVAGDLVGFVAATYLRGVPFVQVPTTLLAMVDASVGGKTGYNHPLGKNLIGAFKQPELVLIDPAVLNTLPEREFKSGLAECIKHGLLGNWALFEWMESAMPEILDLKDHALEKLIADNVKVKADIVQQDEKESGVRALLNLGHTFAHAIEVTSGYGTYKHGEAVALGCVAACFLAAESGMCSYEIYERAKSLFQKAGLPVSAQLASDADLMAAMRRDKKVQDGALRLVLPTGYGQAQIYDNIQEARILGAWKTIRKT